MEMFIYALKMLIILRAFQSAIFNSCQKRALRALYFIRTLAYYYINRSLRHLLVAIENN